MRNLFVRLFLVFFIFTVSCVQISAQWMICNNKRIHSMEVFVKEKKNNVAYITLGGNDVLHFSFDDITKEYHRYVYTVEHCDYQWKKSTRIFDSDYLRGSIRRVPIDEYAESINTTVEYTHYSFTFPNEQLTIVYSGNYRIHVIDDDSKEEVCSYCFSVLEPKASVDVTVTTDTDIDWNKSHQQLKVNLNVQSLNINDTQRELKMVVLQNGRWEKAVWNPQPDYNTPSDVRWEHSRELIFNAGNEFRKFEMTSVKTAMMGVDNIKWFRPFYHATLFTAEDQSNYIYNEDQNGKYYIRTSEYNDDETEADYIWVHFFLKHKPEPNGKLYVYGGLTNWCIIPDAEMKYNNESQLYECALLLKEGYYNYQYMYVPTGQRLGDPSLVDGNYYQTENEYTILVYYTQRGSRYDRLVGYRQFRFAPSL